MPAIATGLISHVVVDERGVPVVPYTELVFNKGDRIHDDDLSAQILREHPHNATRVDHGEHHCPDSCETVNPPKPPLLNVKPVALAIPALVGEVKN